MSLCVGHTLFSTGIKNPSVCCTFMDTIHLLVLPVESTLVVLAREPIQKMRQEKKAEMFSQSTCFSLRSLALQICLSVSGFAHSHLSGFYVISRLDTVEPPPTASPTMTKAGTVSGFDREITVLPYLSSSLGITSWVSLSMEEACSRYLGIHHKDAKPIWLNLF